MSYDAPPPPPPPPGYGYGAAGPPPSNFLVPAILSTIFCCLPAGIVSIVFAAQVNSKWQAGDAAGAQDSARKARIWFWVALALGLIGIPIAIATGLLGAAVDTSS